MTSPHHTAASMGAGHTGPTLVCELSNDGWNSYACRFAGGPA
jgi:hypothetical protein